MFTIILFIIVNYLFDETNVLLEVTMRLVPVPNMILLFLFTHQYSTEHLPLVHVWPVKLHLLGVMILNF